MSLRSIERCCIGTLILAGLIAAQPKPKPNSTPSGQSVVDVVTMKTGTSLRGGIAWREPNGSVVMAVSLAWLRETHPKLAATAERENIENRRNAWTQTRDRARERLKSPDNSPRLAFFLKNESERLDQLLADENPPELDFVWFDISHESLAKVAKATPDQQRIALFGWNEGLAKVETRDAASLSKELTKKGVKHDAPPPDLSDRFPARMQDESEWTARMAVVEFTLGKSLNFQGMGETLTRTGTDQAVNLGEVLPKLLRQQLGSLLNGLTNDNPQAVKPSGGLESLKSAIREAEQAKVHGFRVTRLQIDSTAFRVTVESQFVAQMANGNWSIAWQYSVTEDGTKPRPEAEAQIEKDPRVKTALETAKSFGLSDASTLTQAIRFGAATMAAQQSVDALFAEFRDRYVRQLDSPPLRLP